VPSWVVSGHGYAIALALAATNSSSDPELHHEHERQGDLDELEIGSNTAADLVDEESPAFRMPSGDDPPVNRAH
jgi:hypothetical protein